MHLVLYFMGDLYPMDLTALITPTQKGTIQRWIHWNQLWFGWGQTHPGSDLAVLREATPVCPVLQFMHQHKNQKNNKQLG